jgi:hypothetical protein
MSLSQFQPPPTDSQVEAIISGGFLNPADYFANKDKMSKLTPKHEIDDEEFEMSDKGDADYVGETGGATGETAGDDEEESEDEKPKKKLSQQKKDDDEDEEYPVRGGSGKKRGGNKSHIVQSSKKGKIPLSTSQKLLNNVRDLEHAVSSMTAQQKKIFEKMTHDKAKDKDTDTLMTHVRDTFLKGVSHPDGIAKLNNFIIAMESWAKYKKVTHELEEEKKTLQVTEEAYKVAKTQEDEKARAEAPESQELW